MAFVLWTSLYWHTKGNCSTTQEEGAIINRLVVQLLLCLQVHTDCRRLAKGNKLGFLRLPVLVENVYVLSIVLATYSSFAVV